MIAVCYLLSRHWVARIFGVEARPVIRPYEALRKSTWRVWAETFGENARKFCSGLLQFLWSVVCVVCAQARSTWSPQDASSNPLHHRDLVIQQPHDQDGPPTVLVVGGGPSGLLAAIHLALAHPQIRFKIAEREYPRTHTVILDVQANVTDPVLRERLLQLDNALLPRITNRNRDQDSPIAKTSKRLPIHVLRECLKQRAVELGIVIAKEHLVDAAHACYRYPNVRTVLIAEGAHSGLRAELFGSDERNLEYYPFQNILQVQLTVPGKAKALSWVQLHNAASNSNYVFEESVIHQAATDSSKVSARFFVTDSVFQSLPRGSRTQPLCIYRDLPVDLQDAVATWIRVRNDRNIQEVATTTFELASYASSKFSCIAHEKNWILVGDAAFAVPYFRALNAGAWCALQLPHWLHEFFSRIESRASPLRLLPSEQRALHRRYFWKFSRELFMASCKDAVIETIKSLVFFTAMAARTGARFFTRPNRNDSLTSTTFDFHPHSQAATTINSP